MAVAIAVEDLCSSGHLGMPKWNPVKDCIMVDSVLAEQEKLCSYKNISKEIVLDNGTIVADDDYLDFQPPTTKVTLQVPNDEVDSKGHDLSSNIKEMNLKEHDDEDSSSYVADETNNVHHKMEECQCLEKDNLNVGNNDEDSYFQALDAENRKILERAAKKLSRDLNVLTVLSQNDWMVIFEVDVTELKRYLNLSDYHLEEIQSLSFDLYQRSENERESVAMMQLAKDAMEWKKNKEGSIETDCATAPPRRDSTEYPTVVVDGPTIDSTVQKETDYEILDGLKQKFGGNLAGFTSLSEEEYKVLAVTKNLDFLGIEMSSDVYDDVIRSCKWEFENIKKKRELKKYHNIQNTN